MGAVFLFNMDVDEKINERVFRKNLSSWQEFFEVLRILYMCI